MNIIYACDFSLTKNAGKNRATRQKVSALNEKKGVNLKVYSTNDKFYSPLQVLMNEFILFFQIFWFKPDVVITRGSSGFLIQVIKPIFSYFSVREVHAAGLEELKLLSFKGIKRLAVYFKLKISLYLDKKANLRIFNHPKLMAWYKSKYIMKGDDCFVYNGFNPLSESKLNRVEARDKFDFKESIIYLAFTGAASKWHGVEYLVELQRYFNVHKDPVQIVCGGGSMSHYDPDQLCLNFSPMSDNECADLIRASDACLLPVADLRVSPGSPLKLYDYIANKRTVIAQIDQLGYSDEVDRHRVGFSVDFRAPKEAREIILERLISYPKKDEDYSSCSASWGDRVDEWLFNINQAKNR